MKERLEQIQLRIDAMSVRERTLLFLSLVVVLVMLWQSLLMGPVEARQKQTLSQMQSLQTEIARLNQQTQEILSRSQSDPDAENRRLLEQYRNKRAELEGQIGEVVTGLIAPRQMARVLEEVLTRETRLKLVHLKSLGSQPLLEQAAETAAAGVYVHGLELAFEGSYLETLDYLRAVQALPWSFYWDSLSIEMLDYPRARVTIGVHTLSLEEGWIGV